MLTATRLIWTWVTPRDLARRAACLDRQTAVIGASLPMSMIRRCYDRNGRSLLVLRRRFIDTGDRDLRYCSQWRADRGARRQ
jgi:hypothetical protein